MKTDIFDENANKIKNLIKELNTDDNSELIDNFDKFEIVKNELISKLNSERLIGNTLADLGNFIGQVLYPYIDEGNSSFSEDDFIGGFEHGVDTMREPSKSKFHNFKK